MPFDATGFGGQITGPVAPIKNNDEYNQIAGYGAYPSTPAPAPAPVTPGYAPPDHSGLAPLAPVYTGPAPDHSWLTPDTAQTAFNTQQTAYPSPTNPASPTAPSYSFDSDPGVALAKALENQGIGSLDAWLKAARERLIIQSGDPGLASQAGFGLDPQAGVFAQQNYLSGNADLARVKRAKDLAHKAILDKLAAHGIIRSGDLGYQEGESNMDFGNQEYDVRQGVLSKLSDLMKQYLDQKQTLAQSVLAATQQAYLTQAQNAQAAQYAQVPEVPAESPAALQEAIAKMFNVPSRTSGKARENYGLG